MFSMIIQQTAAKRKHRKRDEQRLAGKWRAALPPTTEVSGLPRRVIL
jgi:hypothetical protein